MAKTNENHEDAKSTKKIYSSILFVAFVVAFM
jgi:hypothetical protein